MLEEYLVAHSAPTLASIKTANLFNYKILPNEDVEAQVEAWNNRLAPKGVTIAILRKREKRALLYVYREALLRQDLARPGVAELMAHYGYTRGSIGETIERLKVRVNQGQDFPHEIGLFLSYPLEDVIGFIENNGKCCKCCGCWKVYHDEDGAKRLFRRFRLCRDYYMTMFCQGKSVEQLTVAA